MKTIILLVKKIAIDIYCKIRTYKAKKRYEEFVRQLKWDI